MSRRTMNRQRGFSLLEALIALVITSFGLLAIAGMSMKLASSEDVARQRGEATRLAQEKIEELRSFSQIESGTGINAWNSLAGATESITADEGFFANTTFTRTVQVLDTVDDAWRRVQVTVAWTDRINGSAAPHTLSFGTVISKTDPFDSAALYFPLAGNTTLKRPKNRNLNIPVPALDLDNGQSVVQVASNFAVVFSNDTGYVVKTCDFVVTSSDQLSACDDANAYIVAGYVSLSGTASFPTGLLVNYGQLTGTTGVVCSLSDAQDQNDTTQTISGYKYYLCVVSVPNAGDPWSGTLRLGGTGLNAGTDYRVCRFQYPEASGISTNQRNVQPYSGVAESLDNQNYVITTSNSCPTVASLASTPHQNCRSGNPDKNLNRATDCPATEN